MTPWHLPPRWRTTFEAVCLSEGVHITRLLSDKRDQALVNARRKVSKVLRWQGLPVNEIGRLLNKDHSTVCHYLNGRAR